MTEGYLGHKSFHPGSLRNIEKVYLQEEKQKERTKHDLQRAQRLKIEREQETYKKLQVQAGLLPASALDRQDWIYCPTLTSSEKVKEDYLLGKPIVDRGRDSRKYPFTPMLKEGSVNPRSESIIKLHEDPMFMMRKEEMRLKKDILSNPVQMKKIYKEVAEKEKDRTKDRKKSKKSKKEKKSKRKSSRNERERSYSKSDRSSSREFSISRSRSRSKSIVRSAKERKEKSSPVEASDGALYREYLQNKMGSNVKFDLQNFKVDFQVNRKQKESKMRVSEEDRSKMIEEMKKNAEDLIVKRDVQVRSFESEEEKKEGNGNFIVEIRKEVYDKKEEVNDLGDRMARNVHYYEKDAEGRRSLME